MQGHAIDGVESWETKSFTFLRLYIFWTSLRITKKSVPRLELFHVDEKDL